MLYKHKNSILAILGLKTLFQQKVHFSSEIMILTYVYKNIRSFFFDPNIEKVKIKPDPIYTTKTTTFF